MEIKQIAENFSASEVLEISKITAGHINRTYLITNRAGERFILQNINAHVFKHPADVIDNQIKINNLLKYSDYPYQISGLRPTLKKTFCLQDKSECWRATGYIEDSKTTEVCPDQKSAFLAGEAYGRFVNYLRGMNSAELKIVITQFRNPTYRFHTLIRAIKTNHHERLKKARDLIDTAIAHRAIPEKYDRIIKKLPLRIVHNDTKISNLLFNENASAIKAIIDFDTVMPGFLIDDFGDLVRSVCNPTREDQPDLSKVVFDVDFYREVLHGYLSAVGNFITHAEQESLIAGAETVIYTQFIRFLSDYLTGDQYYRVSDDEQNLRRAKVQLKLLLQLFEARMRGLEML